MTEPSRTNQKLIEENSVLKKRIQKLEKLEAERKRAEEALRESELHWRLSIDNMLEAYALHEAIFDENDRMVDYRFLEFNPAAQRISNIARENIVGRTAMELYPHIVERGLMDRYADVMATGASAVINDFYYTGDNLDKALDIACFRIDHRHFVCVFRDVTDRKRAEEALLHSEEEARRLAKENKVLSEIGRIINSSLNIDEVYERFAAEARELISFDRITINLFNSRDNTVTNAYISGTELPHRKKGIFYPAAFTFTEEVKRTRTSFLINEENYKDYLEGFPGFALSFQAGFRSLMVAPLLSKDEVIGVLQFRSIKPNNYTEDDLKRAERVGFQIAGAIANAQLFLERKQAEEAREESEKKYYDLYDNAPDMYYSLEVATGAIKECNTTLSRITGYRKEELIGRSIFELFDADSAGDAKKLFQQFPVTGEVHDAERRVKCKDGHIIDVSLNVSAIRDKDGNITHSRSIWRDVTKRKEQEEMIRTLSITDQLTGLHNRRGFMTLAEQQLRVAERAKTGLLVLYADMDGLKQINDKLGHKSGDEAIVETANVLKEVFRKVDIIARMGGDEFAVLAPEASLEHEDIIKNRLQAKIDTHNSSPGRDYNLSLSIGMVYHPPPPPNSLDELISSADTLMYEQKRRNKSLKAQGCNDT